MTPDTSGKRSAEPPLSAPGPLAEPDYWRQLDIFSPTKWTRPVTVIGAGATGSYVAWLLAKMGVKNLTVYDFDAVESHNLPNQMYGPADVGRLKVEALASAIQAATGAQITARGVRVAGGESLSGVVFLLTDTMESRKTIWQQSIRYQLDVDLLIETRMAADGGRVYAVHPGVPREIAAYEKTFYADAEAEEPACTRRAVAPTAAVIAGLAVYTLVSFANNQTVMNETLVSLAPPFIQSKKWR